MHRLRRALCALVLLALLALPSAARAQAASALEVHFIDVGQGDAIFVRSPGGKSVLIDAGNTEAGGVVSAYLTRLGVGALDLVIVSHPHLDHMGGMLDVLKDHAPRGYLDPAYAHPLENYDQLLDWLESQQIVAKVGRAGRTIQVEPGVTMELLSPSDPLLSGTRSDANSNSVVVRLVHGTTSFLFTGDSENETEERMLRGDGELQATVLKVAHHGGRYSTSDKWLDAVQPKFAVISCGNINTYGHPSKPTLDRLENHDVKVFRTDRDGDVIARSDGKTVRWETTGERSAKLDEKGGRRSFNKDKQSQRDPHEHRAQRETKPGEKPEARPEPRPAIVRDEPEKKPVPVIAKPNAAPRPVAQPGLAFRQTARMPALPIDQQPHGGGGFRLLSAGEHLRANVNLAEAEPLAHAARISLEDARRIVSERRARGPFHTLAEVRRVPGIAASSIEALERCCVVRIELNRATHEDLLALGFRDDEARAVVARRQSEGLFTSVDELEEIEALSPERRAKLLPLLTVDRTN